MDDGCKHRITTGTRLWREKGIEKYRRKFAYVFFFVHFVYFACVVMKTGMCLGPDGFGECGIASLWILAARHPENKESTAIVSMVNPEPDRMCLGSTSGGWFSSRRPMGMQK